jgi:ferredoxin-type protein NapH
LKNEIRRRLFKFNTVRRIVQLLSFILFSAVIFKLSEPPLVPVLWTVRTQQYFVIDAFTALQVTFHIPVFPWLALASFLIVGVLLGKSLCGWICPFGFIQDLISFIKRKKTEISPRTHESMIYIKYAVLGSTLFISVTFAATKIMGVSGGYGNALGIFAEAPFTTLSPAETLFAALPRMTLDFRNALSEIPLLDALSGIASLSPLVWVQLFIMVGVLVFSVYVPRGWCKYFCPHGAIMAILNRFSFLGLRRDLVKCAKVECRLCVEACPMNVHVLDLPWKKFSDPECIYCMKCADACPNKAIKLKYP